jgi:type I restriction enzyme R subunit
MLGPEDQARERIDAVLQKAGWKVQDYKRADLTSGQGAALLSLINGLGYADYLHRRDWKVAR